MTAASDEEANPPETWFWLAIEKAVEHSGIAWTHIRPSAVMGAVLEGTYPATGSYWPDSAEHETWQQDSLPLSP